MNKVYKLLAGAVCAALLIAGLAACSGDNSPSGRLARNGNWQGQKADLTGEISSISSNSVTVKLLKLGNGSGAPGAMRSRNPNATRNPNFSRNPNATRPAGFPAATREYTGEEKTLTIPQDAKITSTMLDNGAPAQVEMKLSDLKAGDIVMIAYKDDKATVASVSVMGDFSAGQAPGGGN